MSTVFKTITFVLLRIFCLHLLKYKNEQYKKAAFYTLGCKLNFSETSTIARNMANEGFERVHFTEPADIYVINTCSVTENADKRFKKYWKQAHKTNPDAFIVAVGCYAQLKPMSWPR